MRKGNKMINFFLILLCLAGMAFIVLFLREEQQRASLRQEEINEVAKELEPINEQRREWEKKDKEWQSVLADKQKGRTCILLSFDQMSREIYDTIYELMDQYGFRGTFAMRNGRMPSWEMEKGDEFTSSEMMEKMLDSGWDYAVSIGEEPESEEEETEYQRDFSDEFGDLALESESETESIEAVETESETEAVGFLGSLDRAMARIAENGYEQPTTLFCTEEQFGEVSTTELVEQGFSMVSVKSTEDLPVISLDQREDLWVINMGEYTQKDDQMEKKLDAVVNRQESAVILINDVVKISRDTEYDLSLTAFTSLLNYLKELEADRKINVLTYSEYHQYEQLREEAYDTALAEYTEFRKEMLSDMERLDMEEAAIARKLTETEKEGLFEKEGHQTEGAAAEEIQE
jgi:hypothetical protein